MNLPKGWTHYYEPIKGIYLLMIESPAVPNRIIPQVQLWTEGRSKAAARAKMRTMLKRIGRIAEEP